MTSHLEALTAFRYVTWVAGRIIACYLDDTEAMMQRFSTHISWRFWALFAGLTASCGITSEQTVLSFDTAALHLVVSDFVIGTDTPILEQYDAGNYPDIAAGGDQRLAVFEDGGRIRGVRFDQTGAVLDLEWLDFGVNERTQLYPAVAYGDDGYLVVWSETDETSSSGIYGQIVSRAAALQGQRKLLVTSGFDARVGWLGGAFVMSWVDNGVHLARVDSNGDMIPGSTTDVSAATVTAATRPLIAAQDTLGVVVFSEDDGTRRNVRLARFDAQGTVLDPGGIVVNPTLAAASEYTIATTKTHSLVAFSSDGLIKASIVNAEGTLQAPEFDVASDPAMAGHATAADGTKFAVVWDCEGNQGRDICAKGITTDGIVDTATRNLGVSDAQAFQTRALALAFSNGTYALTYEGLEGTVGHQFSPTFETTHGPLPLSALPNRQNLPFTSWNGEHYVVSFYDERAEGMHARAVRISGQGLVLDPSGLGVSPPEHRAFSSASASNSSGISAFVFTSTDESSAYLRTMNAQAVLSDLVLLSDGDPQSITVVSNGKSFMVAYHQSAQPNSSSTIYVRPLDEMGAPQGEPIPIVPDFPRPRLSMVAQGQDFLLAYSGQALDTGAAVSGKVLRVAASGETRAELPPPTESNPSYAAASSPDGAVIFGWNEFATNSLKFRFLNGDTWSETTALTAQPSEEEPAFVWDGKHFVSVWVESRKALWTRNVGPDGSLGEESVAIPGDHTSPRLTHGPGPEILLTSVNWGLFSRSRRIQSRLVGADGVTLPSGANELDTSDVGNPSTANSTSGAPPVGTMSNPTEAVATSSTTTSAPQPPSSAVSTANTSQETETTSGPSPSRADGSSTSSSSNAKRASNGCSLSDPNGHTSLPPWLAAAFALGLAYARRRSKNAVL